MAKKRNRNRNRPERRPADQPARQPTRQAAPAPARASAAVVTAPRSPKSGTTRTEPPTGTKAAPARPERSPRDRPARQPRPSRLGLPSAIPRPLAAGVVAAWVLVVLLLATGVVTSWTFALFLLLLVAVVAGTGLVAARVARTKSPLRAARAVVLLALALALPVVFDPHAVDVFNLPKDTLLLVGALVLAGLWLTQLLLAGHLPRWRNGLHWLLLGFLAWTALATATSVDPTLSLAGLRGTYDGLWSTAALIVVAFSAAEAFDPEDVPALLGTAVVGAGSLAALYGLYQIHDFKTTGPRWDFVHFVTLPFAHNVFSTFGNPNMWAGFIAIFLPALVVLVMSVRHRLARAGLALLGLVLLAELLQTATRGAWVATIAGLVVFGALLLPELRRYWKLAVAGGGVVVVGAAVLFAAGGDSYLGAKVSALFNAGPASSVTQRFEMWGAALSIAAHHPLVGTGPGTFEFEFLRILPASWVKYLGLSYVADGAHDLFFNLLAEKGIPALLILVAIIVWAGLRAIAAWRNLRSTERSGGAGAVQARTQRWWLAALSAGLAAYLTQAVFNIDNVMLAFAWWCLLGLLLRSALAAGVPVTLRPSAIFGPAVEVEPEPEAAPAWGGRGPSVRGRRLVTTPRRSQPDWTTLARGAGVAVVAAAVVFLGVAADRPWRASHDFWAAAKQAQAYEAVSKVPALSAQATADQKAYTTLSKRAESLDPTLAYFPETLGVSSAKAAQASLNQTTRASDLAAAESDLRQAVRDLPISPIDRYNLASILYQHAGVDRSAASADLAEAAHQLHVAIAGYPRNTTYRTLLAKVESAQRERTG